MAASLRFVPEGLAEHGERCRRGACTQRAKPERRREFGQNLLERANHPIAARASITFGGRAVARPRARAPAERLERGAAKLGVGGEMAFERAAREPLEHVE